MRRSIKVTNPPLRGLSPDLKDCRHGFRAEWRTIIQQRARAQAPGAVWNGVMAKPVLADLTLLAPSLPRAPAAYDAPRTTWPDSGDARRLPRQRFFLGRS